MTRKAEQEHLAIRAWVERGKVHVEFADGREAALPLDAFPRLAMAPKADVKEVQVWGDGRVLHWPALEEAIPVEAVLTGRIPAQPKASLGLAARLKALRKKARLTQQELAERLGCRQSLVSMAENGRTYVSENFLERVTAACAMAPPKAAHKALRGPYATSPGASALRAAYPTAQKSSLKAIQVGEKKAPKRKAKSRVANAEARKRRPT